MEKARRRLRDEDEGLGYPSRPTFQIIVSNNEPKQRECSRDRHRDEHYELCEAHGVPDRGSMHPGGRTLLFPGPPNSSVTRCESQGRGTIHSLEPSSRTRCSCEKLHQTPTVNGLNRVLLPAASPATNGNTFNASIANTTLTDPWLRVASPASRSNYESLVLGGFPIYGKFATENFPSLDYALLANARRKNATRETTSTLKAWLNEHRKNPYPTKGEKIMLAILTKMTLTQVSTWFANARRRLKKENKMTWSPRKKTGDRKGSGGKDDTSDGDSDDDGDDLENMDVNIDVDEDKPDSLLDTDVDMEKPSHGKPSSIPSIKSCPSSSEVQRASVIRTIESPTFEQIKNRFKDDDSPVNNLQRWVNGCFVQDEPCDYPRELTPPSTPVEEKVSPPISSQKLFEAFTASEDKLKSTAPENTTTESHSYKNDITKTAPTETCSVPEIKTEITAAPPLPKEPPQSVITPQPSPKTSEDEFFIKNQQQTKLVGEEVTPHKADVVVSKSSEAQVEVPEVRTQGLTTSREFEAVLALTTLCKT